MHTDPQAFRPAASPDFLPPKQLSRLEQQVVMLSLRDPRSSLRRPSKWEARWKKLFGVEIPNPLADPRLEALRRFSVLMRIDGYSMPAKEYRRLSEAGFDEVIADQVHALVSGRSSASTPQLAGDPHLAVAAQSDQGTRTGFGPIVRSAIA